MDTVVVGRITAVFGVRGWVKLFSFTEDREAIFDYQPWWVETAQGLQQLVVDDWKSHGDGLIVHIKGIDDRDIARTWCQQDVLVAKTQLPSLIDGDFYWHQLEGLVVISHFKGQQLRLGKVKSLLETGANDVLVVVGDRQSIDLEERLIPYAEQFVNNIDLQSQIIDVSWDPEF